MPTETSPKLPPREPEVELSPREKKARLLAKVKVYRESLILDRGAIKQRDPNKQYCWVNQREERRMFFEGMGWEQCTELTAPKVITQYKRPDGTHQRADLVLYQIDLDLYEAICADRELRSIEAIEGASMSFQTTAERLGAPTFKPRV